MEYLLVNFECESIDNERVYDTLALFFTRGDSEWKRNSLIAPVQCGLLLFEMNELMSGDEKGRWNSCTLEVDVTGKYRFLFSYEEAKRLNGVFDDEALFKGYSPGPLAK